MILDVQELGTLKIFTKLGLYNMVEPEFVA